MLAISVYKWGLLSAFLSAVMRIKQDKIYETYKANNIELHITHQYHRLLLFLFFLPISFLLSCHSANDVGDSHCPRHYGASQKQMYVILVSL